MDKQDRIIKLFESMGYTQPYIDSHKFWYSKGDIQLSYDFNNDIFTVYQIIKGEQKLVYKSHYPTQIEIREHI